MKGGNSEISEEGVAEFFYMWTLITEMLLGVLLALSLMGEMLEEYLWIQSIVLVS